MDYALNQDFTVLDYVPYLRYSRDDFNYFDGRNDFRLFNELLFCAFTNYDSSLNQRSLRRNPTASWSVSVTFTHNLRMIFVSEHRYPGQTQTRYSRLQRNPADSCLPHRIHRIQRLDINKLTEIYVLCKVMFQSISADIEYLLIQCPV